jgi:hypothetical protein
VADAFDHQRNFLCRDPKQRAAHCDAIAPFAADENRGGDGADAFLALLIAVDVPILMDCLERKSRNVRNERVVLAV